MQVPQIKITQAHLDAANRHFTSQRYASHAEFINKAIEIAPADQQPWIAVQDEKDYGKNKIEGLIYLWRSNHSYRITGIAKGYELK